MIVMYGTQNPPAVTLAATGLSIGWYFLSIGVLLLAGAALLTVASVLRHRAKTNH